MAPESEFYELMQAYRHAPITEQESVTAAYEAVKKFVASRSQNESNRTQSESGCADCGRQKDDSRYHLDAPGENWGAALHWYVAPVPDGCSEVVERLQECVENPCTDCCHRGKLDRAKAELILHSWRERRVQELENCLREIVNERYTEFDMMRCPFPPNSAVSNAWHDGARAAWRQSDLVKQIAKDALAKSGVARADQEGREP